MPRPVGLDTAQIGIDTIRIGLRKELKRAAQSFIRIGYLLRVTKDTNTLYGSGYKDIYEFASAEFGMDKSQVSRFMRINERFSEGGYSDRLLEHYESFGSSKLAEMLLLPEAVAEELPPEASKAEIRAVVEEIQEEQKITDIEVALEPKPVDPDEPLVRTAFREYFKENPDEYVSLAESLKEPGGKDVDKLLDVLAPSGISMKMVRVSGIGRVMVSIRGAKEPVTVTNVRQNEKESMSLSDMAQKIAPLLEDVIVKGYPARVAWEQLYGKRFPGADPEEHADEENTAESQEASGEEEKRKRGIVDIAKPKEKEKKTGQKAADQKTAGKGAEKKPEKEAERKEPEQKEDMHSGDASEEAGREEIAENVGKGAGENIEIPETDAPADLLCDNRGDAAPDQESHVPQEDQKTAGETGEGNPERNQEDVQGTPEGIAEAEEVAPAQTIDLKQSLISEVVRCHSMAGEAMCARSWKQCLKHLDNMRDAVIRLIQMEEQDDVDGQMTIDGYMREIEE